MRIALFVAALVALALAGYLAITGFFLAHSVSAILRVVTVGGELAAADKPADPLAFGYRGDPQAALSLPFQTVPIETPLGTAEAWLVPAAGTETGRAIYVHGIGGARPFTQEVIGLCLHLSTISNHYSRRQNVVSRRQHLRREANVCLREETVCLWGKNICPREAQLRNRT